MHSYKNLAVLALAASAISPALAAPAQESQKHARNELEARAIGMGNLLTNLAFIFLPSMLSGHGGSTSTSTPKTQRSVGRELSPADEFMRLLGGLSKRAGDNDESVDLATALKLFGRALDMLD